MAKKKRRQRVQRSSNDWLKEIKKWRASGLTQQQFASKISVHPTMISKWNRIFSKDGSIKPMIVKRGGGAARQAKSNFLELTSQIPVFTLKRGSVELSIPVDTDPHVVANLVNVMGE